MNQLRPLSLGEILDRTAELYRSRFGLFAGIGALFAGIMLVVQLAHLGVLALMGYPHVPPGLALVSALTSIVEALAVLLIAGVVIAANTRAVAWIYLGHEATVRSAVASVRPRLGRYLWLMTIAGFKAWAPVAALYAVLIGFVLAAVTRAKAAGPAIAGHGMNHSLITAGIGLLVLTPFLLAATAYGVWMSLRLSLGTPVCVVEDLPARQALRRSVTLSKGTLGRIFVLGLLVFCLRLLVGGVLEFPTFISIFKAHGQASLWVLSWQQIATFITNTLIGPVYAIGLTLFYYDQRIRKEGFDIEWMMQAAGLSELPAGAGALTDSATTIES